MPDKPPPTYETALQGTGPHDQPQSPSVAVTNPQGHTSAPASGGQGAALNRQRSNSSISSTSSQGSTFEDLIGEDGRRSMDDEQRELPEGWVRCFDPHSEHHFYVDEATKRSTWNHPYDDPEYLNSLPDTHPANPNSEQGRAVRAQADKERELHEKAQAAMGHRRNLSAEDAKNNGDRNWFQRKKDQLIGTKEERAKAKEERRKAEAEQRRKAREQQQEYMKRRQELIQKQLNDPNVRRYYASDPYGYSAPLGGYSRSYGSPFGYGYGGGYGRRYGYGGLGYGGYGGYGMGLPLAGGLGGGLLLGSALGGYGGMGYGGMGYGSGFDGGGMGGGGFDMGGAGAAMGGGFDGAMGGGGF